MVVFNPEKCGFKPRADMFLPERAKFMSIFLDAVAIFCIVLAVATQRWAIMIGFLLFGVLGAAMYLCWRNQKITIIDEETFEYSTFLGKKTVYRFSDIVRLRKNKDSLTLFVGEGKVHIESMAYMSEELMGRINAALADKSWS